MRRDRFSAIYETVEGAVRRSSPHSRMSASQIVPA